MMLKNILNKLTRKQGNLGDNRDGGSSSGISSNALVTARGNSSRSGATFPTMNSAHNSVINYEINMNSGHIPYNALPSFRDVPKADRQNLFIEKLSLCCEVFEFTNPAKNLKEKDIKRLTLVELVDYVSSAKGKFGETVIQDMVRMISVNLFRTHSTQPRDVEDDESLTDPAWSHLYIVYEFLLRFVASPETDAKVARRYIDHSFVFKLLNLFDSEDPREREYLKTVIHRIYEKFMVHRPYIRKEINNIFYRFVFETEKHNGIVELLEVLGSIINEFEFPLKEEHKLFLVRVLIPLHKTKGLSMYHQQLARCITQFLEKDSKLAGTVITGLLKYWPFTSSSKELMFIRELEKVLEATKLPEFQRCMVPLFQQIARCICSSHFKVAERALFLWTNNHIKNLIKHNRQVILPIIFPALEENARSHWNQNVQNLTQNVRRMFSDLDSELFEECLLKFQEDERNKVEMRLKREAAWKRLEELSAMKSTINDLEFVDPMQH